VPLSKTSARQPSTIDLIHIDGAAQNGWKRGTLDAIAMKDVGYIPIGGQMESKPLPRSAAEAGQDDGLQKSPQISLDRTDVDRHYLHRQILLFEVYDKLVEPPIVFPYGGVEVGRKPNDALAR